jgi:cell wall-associated NlpC family hydrolase
MRENRFIYLGIIFLATSCSTLKPSSTPASRPSGADNAPAVTFLNNIVLNGPSEKQPEAYGKTSAGAQGTLGGPSNQQASTEIENLGGLQFKYAILLNSKVEDLSNQKLLEFMDQWYGTPYRYGGLTKDGVDCSAFTCLLMSTVYGVNTLPRVSAEQYNQSQRIGREELQEGDLVFFHTRGKKKAVTHVGIYLRNNKFIHASTGGVAISDLGQGYYASHFVGGGRVPLETKE